MQVLTRVPVDSWECQRSGYLLTRVLVEILGVSKKQVLTRVPVEILGVSKKWALNSPGYLWKFWECQRSGYLLTRVQVEILSVKEVGTYQGTCGNSGP